MSTDLNKDPPVEPYKTNVKFTQVPTNKRPRSSPQKSISRKIIRLEYWLNPKTEVLTSQNRYELLSNEESTETKTVNENPPKPPPIFVAGVSDINPLHEVLNKVVPNEYYLKVLSLDEIKIQAKTIKSYDIVITELDKHNTEYHSFKKKEDKPFKVVLKDMHSSTSLDLLKQELQDKGHTVLRMNNIRKRESNTPLPMFFIDLKANHNNKDIYNLKSLLNTCVKFEAPHKKRVIPQCTKCQRYGHIKNFCHHQPRCVKCIGFHQTSECMLQEKNTNVRCVNCEGNHPASYKGCKVYKELQKKTYPPLTRKELPLSTDVNQPQLAPNRKS